MQIKIQELPPLLKFSAAAKLFGISRDTLSNMVDDGRMCKPIIISERVRLFVTAELIASLRASQDCGGLPARPGSGNCT